jgi:hypothetical protein
MIRLLWQFDGRRCIWRVLMAALAYSGVRLLPFVGTIAGIYIGSDLKLYHVALGAVVSVGSGSLALGISRRVPWRALFERRLWTYEEPNPLGFVELLVREGDFTTAFRALRRARLTPLYGASVGTPPDDAPDLTARVGVQEAQAWTRSASDDDRLWRIATVLAAAGLRARVASIDAYPDGQVQRRSNAPVPTN